MGWPSYPPTPLPKKVIAATTLDNTVRYYIFYITTLKSINPDICIVQ